MASHTVIDRCVWHFNREHVDFLPHPIFLPFMCHLRHFEACIDFGFSTLGFNVLSFLMGSLCISLTSPATLEYLEFNIREDDDGFDLFYENLRDADDVWSQLDTIATHPNGSRLQRVVFNINYSIRSKSYYDNDKDDVLKAVLDGLPLLRTKGILFVKVAML